MQLGTRSSTCQGAAALSDHVDSVLPCGYHGPLRRELLSAAGHHDLRVCDDIDAGFPMAGALVDSSIFVGLEPGEKPLAGDLDDALEHALSRSDDTLVELLSRTWREPDLEEIRKQIEDERLEGKSAGPWQVYKDSGGRVVSTVSFKRGLPTVRFPPVQQRTVSSYAVRAINDCTGSGLNPASAACEKMRASGLAALLFLHALIADMFNDWGDDGAPTTAKGDHRTAMGRTA